MEWKFPLAIPFNLQIKSGTQINNYDLRVGV